MIRATLAAAGLLAALAIPARGQEATDSTHRHTDHTAAGGGTVPAGWTVRSDKGTDLKNVKVVPMGGGIHVTLGPAIILYRSSQGGHGPFHTLATFTQTKPTEHPEGYGLFFGGERLEGPAQSYTYFLIRQDGSYLIKRREGEKTSEISKGWVASPAIHRLSGSGSVTNLLEVDAKREPTKVVFKVNGQPVYTADAKTLHTDGIVGLRVNHHLDLHIDGFDVHR